LNSRRECSVVSRNLGKGFQNKELELTGKELKAASCSWTSREDTSVPSMCEMGP
jgi:hypothetical protein